MERLNMGEVHKGFFEETSVDIQKSEPMDCIWIKKQGRLKQ